MGLRSFDKTEDVKSVENSVDGVIYRSYRVFYIRTYSATGITGTDSFARTLYSTTNFAGPSLDQVLNEFSLVPCLNRSTNKRKRQGGIHHIPPWRNKTVN